MEAGFSLLEVLLAVVIGAGLFVAVLAFYQQTAETREAVSEQLEIIGGARRVMQHLTSELRAAAHPDTGMRLSGSSSSVRFATTTLPTEGRTPGSGLVIVAYGIGSEGEDGPSGLTRSEQPVHQTFGGGEDDGDFLFADEESDEAPGGGTDGGAAGPALLLSEHIGFVRFRYWDGSDWSDSWSQQELPRAVQIMLAGDSVPDELEPEEYPPDVFRRTVNIGYTISGDGDAADDENGLDEGGA